MCVCVVVWWWWGEGGAAPRLSCIKTQPQILQQIVLSEATLSVQPRFLYMGAGHVNCKLGWVVIGPLFVMIKWHPDRFPLG